MRLLTVEQRNLLDKLGRQRVGEMADFAEKNGIPKEFVPPVKAIREKVDALSEKLRKVLVEEEGLLGDKKFEARYGKDVLDFMMANDGIYLTRTFAVFSDPKQRERVGDMTWTTPEGKEVNLREEFGRELRKVDVRRRRAARTREIMKDKAFKAESKDAWDVKVRAKKEELQAEGLKGKGLTAAKKVWMDVQKEIFDSERREVAAAQAQQEVSPLSDEELEGEIDALLSPTRVKSKIVRTSMGRADMNVFYARKLNNEYFHQLLREIYGEYRSLDINALHTVERLSALQAQVEAQKMLYDWAVKGDMVADTKRGSAPDATRLPKDNPEFGPFRGKWVTKDLKLALIDYYGSAQQRADEDAFQRVISLGFFKLYGKGMGYARASKTILAPTVQIRNWIANLSIAAVHGHIPWNKTVGAAFRDAWSVTAAAHTGFRESERGIIDRHGEAIGPNHVSDLVKELTRRGVIFDSPIEAIEDMIKSAWDAPVMEIASGGPAPVDGSKIDAVKNAAKAGYSVAKVLGKKTWNAAAATYRAGDDFWKVLGWLQEVKLLEEAYPTVESIKNIPIVKKGYWVGKKASQQVFDGNSAADRIEWLKQEAALRIRDIYPTFSNASEWVRAVRWFPLTGTFPTYFHELARTQYIEFVRMQLRDHASGNSVLRRRAYWKLAGWASSHAFGGLIMQTLFSLLYKMLGWESLDSDEMELLREINAPWSKHSKTAAAKDGKGTVHDIDLSYFNPYLRFHDAAHALWTEHGLSAKLLSALHELTGELWSGDMVAVRAMEAYQGRTAHGGMMFEESDPLIRKTIRRAMHFGGVVEPGGVTTGRRILMSLGGKPSVTGREYDWKQEVISSITGMRISKHDLEKSLGYKISEFDRGLRGSRRKLEKYGISDYDPSFIFYMMDPEGSVSQMKREMGKAEKVRKRLFSDAHNAIEAAIRLGMDERDVKKLLSRYNVKAEVRSALMRKDYIPYWPSPETRKKMRQSGYDYSRKMELLREHHTEEREIESRRRASGKPLLHSFPAKEE